MRQHDALPVATRNLRGAIARKAQERHQVVTSVVFNDILTVIPSTADLALAHRTNGILFQTLPHSGNPPRMRPCSPHQRVKRASMRRMPNAEPEIGQSILRAEPHPVGHQLELPRGQCTVLLGRNGVGKTTLVNCIMGHVPVVSGSMTGSRRISRRKTCCCSRWSAAPRWASATCPVGGSSSRS